MGLDIRLPIGLLFMILGALMAVFGFISRDRDIYERSLNINVNVWWGLILLAFGIIMFLASRRKPGTVQAQGPAEPEMERRGH